ncbi:MAG: hypothetical protein ACJ76Y_28555 [Thermoanaerobaculia bacterium]
MVGTPLVPEPDNRVLDLSQGSLVFINACFALALGGLFYVTTKSLDEYKVGELSWSQFAASLEWLLLATYLVFVVWRKYSTYVIPLQQARNELEPHQEQVATFLVTVWLTLISIFCLVLLRWRLVLLGILILLTLNKVRQMRGVLAEKLPTSKLAVVAIDHQVGLLNLNLFFLFLVLLLLFSWEQYLSVGWFASLEVFFSYLLNKLVGSVYSGFYPGYNEEKSEREYLKAVLETWNVKT